MADSKTQLCNMALSHLGTGKEIADLDTEKSEEASACRRFYDIARKATLRDIKWPFAKTFGALGLVSTNPTTEWLYSYRYPSDCVKFIRILSGVRNDTRQSRVPYILGRDSQGVLIYTDEVNAVAEYTFDLDDPVLYTPDFDIMFSIGLAIYVAPRLTKGDPFKMQDTLRKYYMVEKLRAQSSSLNEEQSEEDPRSEFERARE